MIEDILLKAKQANKRVILPETADDRTDEAAARIKAEGIARLVEPEGVDKKKIAHELFELRKGRGMSEEAARELIEKDQLYRAAMMVRLGMADTFVAGISNTSRDVIKAAMHCLGVDRSVGVVSGAFVIVSRNKSLGSDGILIFADCAVIPQPSAKQLSRIAVSTAGLLKRLFNIEPRVALLTYSSHGSGEGESIDRARGALAIIKDKKPDMLVDGELQMDASIVPEIAKRKAPESPIQGRANVLIFPNLDAANLTYKAIERFCGAKAIGPVLLGMNRVCSDLSRGCSVEDIVNTVALTSVLCS